MLGRILPTYFTRKVYIVVYKPPAIGIRLLYAREETSITVLVTTPLSTPYTY